jgi:hypothetical protein
MLEVLLMEVIVIGKTPLINPFWGPEDEVYHDDALLSTMAGPPHWQVDCFID